MKQPVDSFFNKKLKDHAGTVPPTAWDRIDANLSGKKKPFPWLKIAASFFLIMTAGIIVDSTLEKPMEPIAEIEKSLPAVENEIIKEEPEVHALATVQEEQSEIKIPTTTQVRHTPVKTEKSEKALEPIEPLVEAVDPFVVIAENSVTLTDVSIEEITVEPEIQNTTIHISVEEANAKYLNQQFVADATTENKKSSKIRNLFDKAQDLDPIGEIRQFKNEVLALSFRNEKKGERNR